MNVDHDEYIWLYYRVAYNKEAIETPSNIFIMINITVITEGAARRFFVFVLIGNILNIGPNRIFLSYFYA